MKTAFLIAIGGWVSVQEPKKKCWVSLRGCWKDVIANRGCRRRVLVKNLNLASITFGTRGMISQLRESLTISSPCSVGGRSRCRGVAGGIDQLHRGKAKVVVTIRRARISYAKIWQLVQQKDCKYRTLTSGCLRVRLNTSFEAVWCDKNSITSRLSVECHKLHKWAMLAPRHPRKKKKKRRDVQGKETMSHAVIVYPYQWL